VIADEQQPAFVAAFLETSSAVPEAATLLFKAPQ